jgi:branched-chain amino acid transport system ATP-binding protein
VTSPDHTPQEDAAPDRLQTTSTGAGASPIGPTDSAAGETLLEITNLVVGYGRIEALHGISLKVRSGELVTLIGANGAGKTTTMRAISGIRPLTGGKIVFDGQDITKMKAHQRVLAGIVQAPEGRGVFPGMTVLENLDMGCYARKFATKAEYQETLDRVFELFPRLGERRTQVGGTMSGGEQQMLAIGRALMARPRLLLLDEPSMGLAPMVIQQIFRIIGEINARGTTILLVEQNAQQALSRSHRAYVLETGEISKTGSGREMLADPAVKEAYLGVA